jgi:carbon monoxide dehydrogenase subunit G
MNLNEPAPVTSTRELKIEATPEAVWSLLTDINNWPSWNTAVSRARLHGAFVPGSVFRWKSGGSSIVSTLKEVEEPKRVSWTGKGFGISAVHVWTIEANGTGVLVRTSESFDGWLVRLLRSFFQRLLDRTLEDALRSLKAAAEKSRQGGSTAAA